MKTIDIALNIMTITSGVASALAAPKLFIPSFVVGTIVGTVAAVAFKTFKLNNGTKFEDYVNEIIKEFEKNENQNYKYIHLISGICHTLLNTYQIFAQKTGQVVHPIFSFLGNNLSLSTGLGLGAKGGFYLTKKIITVMKPDYSDIVLAEQPAKI